MVTIKKAKASAKTVTPKKMSAEKVSKGKQTLVCAQNDQCFWVHDGTILSNVLELRDTLSKIAEEIFYHHVHDDRNDFADWVEYVLNDKELAKGLRKAKSTDAAYAVVVKRLKAYSV